MTADVLHLWARDAVAELIRLQAELEARKPLPWEPQFDFMAPGQEDLAMQFCIEIAGLRGQKGSPPDPVRLMEMAEALYKAEADARLVDKSPNLQEPLVDKATNLQDRGTRKPLPPDALADKCEAWLQAGGAANIVDAFEAGYRAAEET